MSFNHTLYSISGIILISTLFKHIYLLAELKAKFFESGWSEGSSDAIQPPGFFENLMSGGKKMAAWDEENRKNS